MNEDEMTRQLFDDLVGTPPPSTVDVKGIVRREQRARRLRHAGTATAVAVAVLAAGITAGLVLRPAQPPATPAATGKPPVTATQSIEPREQTEIRLNSAWQAATARLFPGAAWSTEPDRVLAPTAPRLNAVEGAYFVDGEIVINGVSNRFSFSAAESHARMKRRECDLQRINACLARADAPCLAEGGCTTLPGPPGFVLTVRQDSQPLPGHAKPAITIAVIVVNEQGRAVFFRLRSMQAWSDIPLPVDLVATVDQLRALVTDPDLLP